MEYIEDIAIYNSRTTGARNRFYSQEIDVKEIDSGMNEKGHQSIEWKESWQDEYLKWICGYATRFSKFKALEAELIKYLSKL